MGELAGDDGVAAMTGILAALRILVLTVRSVLALPVGFVIYWCTGRTPVFGHQALIWLFCVTQGRSNDLLSRAVSLWRPKLAMQDRVGVLGNLEGGALAECVGTLRSKGFVVFERALPAETCDRLMRFALDTQVTARRMDGQVPGGENPEVLFDPKNPSAVRYDYAASVLLDNADVQSLLADQSILSLAQEYLGCRPIADILTMWWHTNYHKQPDAQAAQFFHFDMDRIKWLKIFIYLTDVGPDNGPHSFVCGSHRTGGIPSSLLLRGYERLPDEEVHRVYSEDARLEFSAPRGSIIVEDTRGLHKGANVRGEPRLVLQLQFSNDLFGAICPKSRITRVVSPAFQQMLVRDPAVYAQYT